MMENQEAPDQVHQLKFQVLHFLFFVVFSTGESMKKKQVKTKDITRKDVYDIAFGIIATIIR